MSPIEKATIGPILFAVVWSSFGCMIPSPAPKASDDIAKAPNDRPQDEPKKPSEEDQSPPPKPLIEAPINRGFKKATEFSKEEKTLDHDWVDKKRQLATTYVIDKRRELAGIFADEMNKLTDDQFTFLTMQPYFWSDLVSVEAKEFSSRFSKTKLRIAADAIVNNALKNLVPDLPLQIGRLFSSLDIEDPMLLEKLEAALPAATVSEGIESELQKKAIAFRQKMKIAHDDQKWQLGNLLLEKLQTAKKIRLDNLKQWQGKTKAKSETQRPKRKEEEKKAPAPKKQEPQIDWAAVKQHFQAWLAGDKFDIKQFDLNDIKLNIQFLLKAFLLSSDQTYQNKLRTAFVKTMEQHSVINDLFDVLKSIVDEQELATFMRLLTPKLLDHLWASEKELIIAGESVRERQKARLAVLFHNLSADQLEASLANQSFWTLLEDQPKAAAKGLTVNHYQRLAKYFIDRQAIDATKATGFAKKVIIQLDPEDDPDHVYAALMALAGVAKLNTTMESALAGKRHILGVQLKAKHGADQADAMLKALQAAMKP